MCDLYVKIKLNLQLLMVLSPERIINRPDLDRTGSDLDRTGTGPGSDRDRTWIGLWPDLDQTGTGSGSDWDRTWTDRDRTWVGTRPVQDRPRTKPVPDLDRTWSVPVRSWTNLDRIWIVSLDLTWAPEGESSRLLAATSVPHHEVNLLQTSDLF